MPRAILPVLALAALVLVGGIVAVAVGGGESDDAPTATPDETPDSQASGDGEALPDDADEEPSTAEQERDEDADLESEESDAPVQDDVSDDEAGEANDATPDATTSDDEVEAQADRRSGDDTSPGPSTATDGEAETGEDATERTPQESTDADDEWSLALPETGAGSPATLLLFVGAVLVATRRRASAVAEGRSHPSHR